MVVRILVGCSMRSGMKNNIKELFEKFGFALVLSISFSFTSPTRADILPEQLLLVVTNNFTEAPSDNESIFNVFAGQPVEFGPSQSLCTAFVGVNSAGKKIGITAAHCASFWTNERAKIVDGVIVEGASIKDGTVTAKFQNYFKGPVINPNPSYDAATLAIPGDAFQSTKAFPLSVEPLKIGDKITIAGYPLGTGPFTGNCINKGVQVGVTAGEKNPSNLLFVIDCPALKGQPVHRGMSGGPALNSKGEIVGVVTQDTSLTSVDDPNKISAGTFFLTPMTEVNINFDTGEYLPFKFTGEIDLPVAEMGGAPSVVRVRGAVVENLLNGMVQFTNVVNQISETYWYVNGRPVSFMMGTKDGRIVQ
jgi:hypothetical protein